MAYTARHKARLAELKTAKTALLAAIHEGETSFSIQGSITANYKSAADMAAGLDQINAEMRAILQDITGNDLLRPLEYRS